MQQQVRQAVKAAASRTGVSFAYLMKKAAIESGSDPNAKAKTSSATGLFQFTDQTWLRMVKSRGTQYGLGKYADQIQVDTNGTAYVSDPAARKTILELRENPEISAEMTCELDKENSLALQRTTGCNIGPTELYLAHFLGASGAVKFLNTMQVNPNATAADVLPKAAGSNPSIFYRADGQARSVSEIYRNFARQFDQATADPVGSVGINYAATSLSPVPSPVSSTAPLAAKMILEQMDLTRMAMMLAEDSSEESSAISVSA